jgi:FlaA1/EpsC-like NDP-sugar epimerase
MRRPDFHLRRYQLWQMAGDGLLIALAYFLAFQLRFLDDPGTIPARYVDLFFGSVAFVVAGKLVIFYLFGLYQKWWRFIGGRDVIRIVQAVTISSLLLIVVFAVAQPFADSLPRSVAMTDFLLTLMLIAGARLATRLFKERPERGSRIARGREVLVVGAGSGGQMVVRELRLNPNLGETAIGFVDDNNGMRGMRIQGISVLGTTDEIGTILDETEPDQVVIAIPSAPGTLRAKVVAACRERQIPVRTLPTVFELLRGGVQLSQQLREVRVEDVLGREPVVFELERVGAYLEDQVVLVTGAGGSIGSELCRQIARVNPRLLVMLDHAEDNLFQIEREMVAERHFSRVEAVLADCKEVDRMFEVMQRFRPSVVFHAAAYKHVPLMESNPLEAIRNNAIATRITAETAAAAGAGRFVLVSTDKAVAPKTVMGASKALAEWAVTSAGERNTDTRFVSVRFGNVLGSSGSVVPIFRRQIEMTRFFMTIPEAVQLVIRAGDTGNSRGDVFVLDMGDPVRIVDLAENMIKLAGLEPEKDIAIEFTGPRPGEKLHEELFGPEERPQSTASKRIMRAVRNEPIDSRWVEGTLDRLEQVVRTGDESHLAETVVGIVNAPGVETVRIP